VREIETKYRIPDAEALFAALKRHGIELSSAIRQEDQAYAPQGWSFGQTRIGVPFLRIRTIGDRHVFTMKKPVENALSCEEYETLISAPLEMHQAIIAMGFRPTVRIAKTRRTAQLADISLCVDEVDTLGTFLELERMAQDDVSADDIQNELAQFVDKLGINAVRVEQTYDTLVYAAAAAT
jgi:adenylate cyclase class 2